MAPPQNKIFAPGALIRINTVYVTHSNNRVSKEIEKKVRPHGTMRGLP